MPKAKIKIEIFVNNELKYSGYSEFVAMNNCCALREEYGRENVKVVRREEE